MASPRPEVPMRTRFDLVTIDAADAPVLVAFWSAALELTASESEDDGRWTVLSDTALVRRIGIQRITGLLARSDAWAGVSKARLHLDLACDPAEFIGEVDRLIGLGASRARDDRNESYGSIANLRDPEGNLFDLCAYL
jgi:predicted enzyme related to lactoylglutathione lyase